MLAPVAKHPILHNIDKVKGQPKKRKEKEKKKKRVIYQEILNTLTSSFIILLLVLVSVWITSMFGRFTFQPFIFFFFWTYAWCTVHGT